MAHHVGSDQAREEDFDSFLGAIVSKAKYFAVLVLRGHGPPTWPGPDVRCYIVPCYCDLGAARSFSALSWHPASVHGSAQFAYALTGGEEKLGVLFSPRRSAFTYILSFPTGPARPKFGRGLPQGKKMFSL